MDARATTIRDVWLLAVAAALGAVLVPSFALVGLPIAAAGLAGLAYRGHALVAAASAAVGIAIVAVLDRASLAYAAPAIVAALLAVVLLPKWNVQAVGALLVAVLALAGIGADALAAYPVSLPASIAKSTRLLVADMAKQLGASGTPDVVARLRDIASVMTQAWPWAYFESALLLGVLVITAVAWAARRAGKELDVPPLSKLDLTPHVLWAFVGGLLLLAASYASFAGSKAFYAVGLNLVLCARTLFFLQGMSVSAGVLERAGVGLGGRILALAALAVLDALTLVLSFVGLLDFWVNFRRLPRDGGTPAETTEVSV